MCAQFIHWGSGVRNTDEEEAGSSKLYKSKQQEATSRSILAMEAIGPELALFYRPPSQRTVEGCEYREYKPSTPLDGDSPVEINIANNGTSYVALDKSKLKVTVRIVRGDGSPLPKDKKDVGVVNCLLHALWSQVQLIPHSHYSRGCAF